MSPEPDRFGPLEAESLLGYRILTLLALTGILGFVWWLL